MPPAKLLDRLLGPGGFGPPVLPVILMLALALRVGAALMLPDQQFADAESYRAGGASLWATGLLGQPLIMPLYPAIVGLVGPGWGQVTVDIVLSTLMVALVHQLTLAVFADRAAAALAALWTALYPYFVFYAVVGLTETLFTVLLLGAFLCWFRGRFTAAAVLAVLSILTRPTIELLVPVLILFFALFVHRLPPLRALRHLAIYASIYGVLMSPWWLHNYREYGTFVRLNAGSGVMLYSGNNPHNQSGGALESDSDRKQFGAIADPVARDRAMWAAGVAYIKENPGRFLELAAIKFVRFWRLWPYAPEYAGSFHIILSLMSFVPALAFAIIYLLGWGRREFIVVAPILLLIGYFTFVHMVLAASLRYRLPLEPFLISFAAVGMVRLARSWGGRWIVKPLDNQP